MSDLLNRMDIQLHARMKLMRTRLDKLKNGAKAGLEHAEDDFYDYVDDIEDALESGRERVAAASDIVEDWVLETQDNIENWRTRKETKKLAKEADKAHNYAEAAMDVAIASLDEAEWALARALRTRSYAESSEKEDAA